MSDSRARVWFSLFVLAVFCLGGAGGFLLGRHAPPMPPLDGLGGPARDARPFGREGPGRRGGPPFGGPIGLPPEAAGRLAVELQLDETQRDRLRQLLDDHRAKFEIVHREARDRFVAEQRQLQGEIRGILRPDQVQRFDRFISGRQP